MPYLLVERAIEEGVVEQVPLTEPMERNLNIIYHKSKYLTGNMNTFIELCKQYGEETDPRVRIHYIWSATRESPGKWCWGR